MRFTVEDSKNRGSITVEASLVVPVIILSISAVIYIGLLLYQRALVQSAADMAAEAGADIWALEAGEIGTGKPDAKSFEKNRLYRRIYDTDKGTKLKHIEEYAAKMASRGELLHPAETVAEVVIKDYIVCRKLEVRLTKQYSLPLGNFMKLFGGSGMIEISVKAASSIDEPVELMRSTDFILDMERKLENKYPDIKNLGEKTRNAMSSLKDKLNGFLDE